MSKKLDEFRVKINKRKINLLFKLALLICISSICIGLLKPTPVFSIVLGLIIGIVGSRYLTTDLNAYKRYLLKEELHRNIVINYIKSDKVNYLYYSNGVPSTIKQDVEAYALGVLDKFEKVLNISTLKVVIVTEPIADVVNTLFVSLDKKVDVIGDDVAGTNIVGMDCILINYFGLSVNDCIGHEFIHFLLNKDKNRLLKDKLYVNCFNSEKDNIFTLDYEEYYRNSISEFSAELGSKVLKGNKDVLQYKSAILLESYLEKFVTADYIKKRLY